MPDKTGILNSANTVAKLIAMDLVPGEGEEVVKLRAKVAAKWTKILNLIFKHISENAVVTGFDGKQQPITETQIL